MPKYLSISLSVAIFLAFGYVLFQNALNAPSFDDYDTTVNFIRRFFFEHFDLQTRLKVLLSRQNEHRIFLSKSLAAVYYHTFGELNFRSLVLIQNIFLVAFFALLLVVMYSKKWLSPVMALWAAVFIFSLAFWQDTFYYWGGIQHYTVFFFSFSALYLLDRAQRIMSSSFFLALLAGGLAVLSFGNGFIALLLGCFILFAQQKRQMLAVWAFWTAVLVAFSFLPRPDSAPATGEPFHFDWMLRLLLTFAGSFVYINPSSGQHLNIILCMAVGFAVLAFWGWLLLKGYALKEPLLYALLSLPLLTGIIIAISRFESKAAGGIAPRYMFFTASIPVILVLILLDLKILKSAHLGRLAAAGVLLWGAVFYHNLRDLHQMNEEITVTLRQWQNDRNTPLIYYKDSREYSEILGWATARKVVSIPEKSRNNATDETTRN